MKSRRSRQRGLPPAAVSLHVVASSGSGMDDVTVTVRVSVRCTSPFSSQSTQPGPPMLGTQRWP